MKVLQDQIEHHIEEGGGQLFKMVRANLDNKELEVLGEQMDAMFQQLKEDEPRSKVPAQTERAAPLQ